jgi:hypothetical protein
VAYGRVGEPTSHRRLGLRAYSPIASPALGNLLFIRPDDVTRLMLTARLVAPACSTRAAVLAVPGLRSAARRLLRR